MLQRNSVNRNTKKAYKFPVKKFHPDKCKGKKRKEAEQKFIEIQEAEIQASLRYKNMKSYLVVENKLYGRINKFNSYINTCLLYTSPSPRDQRGSRMPSSA